MPERARALRRRARDARAAGAIPKPPPHGRSEYQRDRDRIIHSTAFRRLEYKTQVFVNHEGDLFRTRLTHSLEVAQIGRSIARNLGSTRISPRRSRSRTTSAIRRSVMPARMRCNACMKPYGGFEHNLQSLRVVDVLEQRYAAFDGLNLTFETREGILKHCSLQATRASSAMSASASSRRRRPSLEAQIANLADEIAYNNHDVDDGLRSGPARARAALRSRDFQAAHARGARSAIPGSTGRRLVHETVRRMIDTLVTDLIDTSAAEHPAGRRRETLEDVRAAPALIALQRRASAKSSSS